MGLPYDRILFVFVCGMFFRAKDENGERLLQDIRFEKTFYYFVDSAFEKDIEKLVNKLRIDIIPEV